MIKLYTLLLIILLVGCSVENPPAQISDFRSGHDGVEFEFQPNRPPNQIFEEDSVPLSISLQNKGAATITSQNPVTVTVALDNYYLDFAGRDGINLAYSGELLGKSRDFPHGQLANELIIGSLGAKKLQGQIESPKTSIYVNICYPYTTTFYGQVCVNSDFYYTDERRQICESSEIFGNGGQGAPVAVSKVIPRISLVDDTNGPITRWNGDVVNTAYQVVRPVFEIYIENKNDGIPYFIGNSDVKNFCELNDVNRKTQLNKVRVTATLDATESNPGILDCDVMNPAAESAVVTLIDNKGIVYCMPPNDETIIAEYNYYAQLSVKLDYVYSEGKTKELEILRKQFG